LWAAMISVRFLRNWSLPGCFFPAGLVVVWPPLGVAEERWMPVFM